MCFKQVTRTSYVLCNHSYAEPPEGTKVDCGSRYCRMSNMHPEDCIRGQGCEDSCWQYMRQPRVIDNAKVVNWVCPRSNCQVRARSSA